MGRCNPQSRPQCGSAQGLNGRSEVKSLKRSDRSRAITEKSVRRTTPCSVTKARLEDSRVADVAGARRDSRPRIGMKIRRPFRDRAARPKMTTSNAARQSQSPAVGVDEPGSLAIADQRIVFDWIFTALHRVHLFTPCRRAREGRRKGTTSRCRGAIFLCEGGIERASQRVGDHPDAE
jgi:hypothetical protein